MNRETVIRKERKMKELFNKADSLRVLDENQKRNRDNQNELLRDNNSFASILKCFVSCFYSGQVPLRDLEIDDFTLITEEEERYLGEDNEKDIEDFKELIRSIYHKLNVESVIKTDGISIFACTNVNSDYENVYKKGQSVQKHGTMYRQKKERVKNTSHDYPFEFGLYPCQITLRNCHEII